MAYRRYNKTSGGIDNIVSTITSFLPLVLILMLVMFFMKSFNGGLLSKMFNVFGDNSKEQQDNAQTDFGKIEEKANKNNIKPTAANIAKANSIYQLMNHEITAFMSAGFWNTQLTDDIQKAIHNALNKQGGRNIYETFLAYGLRTCPNRRIPLLGLFADNNKGTLRDHVSKYMTGQYKTSCLTLLDQSIKAYGG